MQVYLFTCHTVLASCIGIAVPTLGLINLTIAAPKIYLLTCHAVLADCIGIAVPKVGPIISSCNANLPSQLYCTL